ncbi:MAG: discoidin domain-containing protein, partial [Methylococcaceae bacterium]|nr:discoidin domain-containing protein [Methylococcaceae bacterium]
MRYWVFIFIGAGLPWACAAEAADTPDSSAPVHWTAEGQGGAVAQLRTKRGHLQLDYDSPKGEGYLWLRRRLDADLPERYALQFNLRGRGSVADFEIRLTDPAARNVWNWRRYDYHWPEAWQTLSIPVHSLEFAWGPSQSPLTRAGSLEWLITPGKAGKGSVEFGDVAIEAKPRLVDPDRKPAIQATSALPGHPSDLAIDASEATFWHSDRGKGGESLTLDFGGYREFGGLTLDWCARDYAKDFQLRISTDGKVWQTLKSLSGRHGGLDTLFLPDSESRYLQLSMLNSEQGEGYCLRNLAVMPIAAAASPNAFFTSLAERMSPGTHPKYFLGQQTYFTVIGAPDGRHEGLLNEEGSLEAERGGHTLEPFLFRDGKLVTWRDGRLEQTLERGDLPIPSVTWHDREVNLQVTAFATGREEEALFARYRLQNTGSQPIRLKLFLAIRPFQVNPPWQSLNMSGGFSPLRSVEWQSGHLRVNEHLSIVPMTAPEGVGATTFDQGEIVEFLRQGHLPEQKRARDPNGLASAALAYDLTVPAGGSKELFLAIPHGDSQHLLKRLARLGSAGAAERLRQVTEEWSRHLAGPDFTGPPAALRLIPALRTNLAYLLINRDAPALYPGSRAYARAWIRDGALMAAALLGMGHNAEVRDVIGWYAEYQRPDGTIPCCIDRRGADPL